MKVIKIISPQFQEALTKLSNQELPPKSAKKVLSIIRLANDSSNDFHTSRIDYMSKIAEKDKKGKPKVDDKNQFILPKDKLEEINEHIREMMNKDIDLSALQISLDDLGDIRMTAQELSLLEDLFI